MPRRCARPGVYEAFMIGSVTQNDVVEAVSGLQPASRLPSLQLIWSWLWCGGQQRSLAPHGRRRHPAPLHS